MMVMTAKVNFKKIAIGLIAAIAVIVGLIALFGGEKEDVQPTATGDISSNDARVKFLTDFGWDVSASPVESGQVRIPQTPTEVYERYNALQKSQGYDLSSFAGKAVMRYVYKINNYPGATEPVYGTLLIYKNQVIGGDVTDTSATGVVQGFKMKSGNPEQPQTLPTTPTAPSDTVTP